MAGTTPETKTAETRITPWVSTKGKQGWERSPIAAYRIWQMYDGMNWWQRHEWRHHDGSEHLDDWIRGISGFSSHAHPA